MLVGGAVKWGRGGLRTGRVDAAVGRDGERVLGRAAVEGKVDGLDVVTLLEWHGGSAGQQAEGRSEDAEVLHGFSWECYPLSPGLDNMLQ